jgi:hypothetical protein
MASEIVIALGIVRSGDRTSSPMVAMRAYPANAKNSRPADCSTPYTDPSVPPANDAGSKPDAPAATTTASTASTSTTMTRASCAVRVTPK